VHYLSLLKLVDFFLFKLGVVDDNLFVESFPATTLSTGIFVELFLVLVLSQYNDHPAEKN